MIEINHFTLCLLNDKLNIQLWTEVTYHANSLINQLTAQIVKLQIRDTLWNCYNLYSVTYYDLVSLVMHFSIGLTLSKVSNTGLGRPTVIMLEWKVSISSTLSF